MDNVTLKEILETIAEFEQGKLEMSEKIFRYQHPKHDLLQRYPTT
jgi:hypothetical protein